MASTTEQVRAASEDDQKRTAGEYKGQKVTGANGEDLGKVNDFVVDTQSGKVAFAVVSSGGFLGMGDKLRLVEHNSLQPQAAAEGFTAQMDKVAFEALPVITQQDLDAGKISVEQKKAGSSSSTSSPASSSSSSGMSQSGKYALASKLSGKSARAGEREAGSITDVVIDIENGQAHALFEPKSEFAGASGKFMVPLAKFEVGSPQAQVIATTLSRSDFSASSQSSTDISTTETLTPTGRSSSGAYPGTPSASSTSGSSTGTSGDSSSAPSSPDTSISPSPSSSSSPDTSSTSRGGDSGLGSTSPSSSGAAAASTASSSSDSLGSPSSTTGSSDPSSSASSPGSSTSPGGSTSRISSADTSSPSLSSSAQTPSHTPDRAMSSSSSAAGIGTTSSGTAVSTDEQLAPTGRTKAVTEAGESISTGSIRSALHQDTTLAQENVQVEAKIILRGTVSSEAMKTRAEELARRAAHNAEIDNQITVSNK